MVTELAAMHDEGGLSEIITDTVTCLQYYETAANLGDTGMPPAVCRRLTPKADHHPLQTP